ncbi:hypothetical protein ACHAW6_008048 [Cyclotella cf. meneghiniana]
MPPSGRHRHRDRDPDRLRSPNTDPQSSPLDPSFDPSELLTVLESASETCSKLPTPAEGERHTLRPTEIAHLRDVLTQTWNSVRSYLSARPAAQRSAAASHQNKSLLTPLHMACKLVDPPPDVIQMLIDANPDTLSWQDTNGWLPLHNACYYGASCRVLQILVDGYERGKETQDKHKRTPLHFALSPRDLPNVGEKKSEGEGSGDGEDGSGNSMPEVVRLLSDSGAAELQDEWGMLPIHYASAYGTTREVLQVLLENYPESLARKENKGRNPLHLAMVNAHRKYSPTVVEFLLEQGASDIINVYDDDNHLPIHLLAMLSKFPPDKVWERKNAADCLKLYLDYKPQASADFLTAVQTLPEWLRDIAVISDHIQNILNHKIVMRFPTMILILDFFFLIFCIVLFEITTGDTIDYLFTIGDENVHPPASTATVALMLMCGAYFLLREVVQIVSLVALGNFSAWLWDLGNSLDVAVILLVFFFGSIMLTGEPLVSDEAFRNGAAITKGILWMSVISFLKSTQVEFSVFVSGVIYVVQRLSAFLLALGVILLMFAQMFYIVYAETEPCECGKNYTEANAFPHCSFPDSLLKVYTMMMGEIGNEMRYSTSGVAQFLYVAFAFLVVILLSNVLIAIVTDSYGVIKNERAAMVFWSNRLDFVAEMDAILNVTKRLWGRKKDRVPGAPTSVQERQNGDQVGYDDEEKGYSNSRFRAGWKSIMNLFDPNLYDSYDVNPSSFEFWCYFLVRFAAVVFVIPAWLIVGLCTAGWLWPPQVREYLFQQKKAAISRADMAEQVTAQINELKEEIQSLRTEIQSEMKCDRKEFALLKAEVEAVQAEVIADLLQVKEFMIHLLEMSKDHLGAR